MVCVLLQLGTRSRAQPYPPKIKGVSVVVKVSPEVQHIEEMQFQSNKRKTYMLVASAAADTSVGSCSG